MEAVGSHRELIFISDEQLNEKPLYRMAVHRSQAVRFLRSCLTVSCLKMVIRMHQTSVAQSLQIFVADPVPFFRK